MREASLPAGLGLKRGSGGVVFDIGGALDYNHQRLGPGAVAPCIFCEPNRLARANTAGGEEKMKNWRVFFWLAVILVLAGVAIWVDLPGVKVIGDREIRIYQGLDLQGGLQVLLVADLPPDQEITPDAIEAARRVIESRVNGLGVTEPLVQTQGTRRIIVELPGIEDPDLAIATIKETGLLEFIDTEGVYLEPGTRVRTDVETASEVQAGEEVTGTTESKVYHTVMTGQHLEDAKVVIRTQRGIAEPMVSFELDDEGRKIFAEFTSQNVGKYLAIVLDKEVISCPVIKAAITDGAGVIEGNFTRESANALAVQLRYGSLPIPLRVETVREVGPTLGRESVDESLRAGLIGLSMVLLFMLIYYRLPGLLADLALILYALLNLMLYKLIPVTLTLPGLAGFLLSAGMAVDANILIFERMKEELRNGRSLLAAINAGFDRAWTSIRDSQISTLIICAVLYIFGSNFGASMVKGFAITLALGTVINIFTAVTATRTFIQIIFDLAGEALAKRRWLLGI